MSGNTSMKPGSVQETLVIPLYARKLCAQQFPTLYTDEYAAAICERIDYDFSQWKQKETRLMYQFGGLEGAMREKDMIWEIRDYLKMHPNAAVVSLGCGLSTTGRSADNGLCKRYQLDFPDVIQLRNELIPVEEREENIGCDLNDVSWMDRIDSRGGAMFYAAGVFHYFKTEQVKRMVAAMAEVFPGGRLVFDTVGRLGRDLLMRRKLNQLGMKDVSGMFCAEGARDLEGWSRHVTLAARKSYMRGYVPLDDPNIRWIHRFLAVLCNIAAKMYINRMEFSPRSETGCDGIGKAE